VDDFGAGDHLQRRGAIRALVGAQDGCCDFLHSAEATRTANCAEVNPKAGAALGSEPQRAHFAKRAQVLTLSSDKKLRSGRRQSPTSFDHREPLADENALILGRFGVAARNRGGEISAISGIAS
jgi:hypothetical protein